MPAIREVDAEGRELFVLSVRLRPNDSADARAKSLEGRRDDSGRPAARNRISSPAAGDRSVGKTSRRLPSPFS